MAWPPTPISDVAARRVFGFVDAMGAARYKIWATGNPVGIGVTGAVHIGLAGIAKKATAAEPHVVGNEVLCNRIAQGLLLPCPPGALIDKDGETYFFSLDFNLSGLALPPALPPAVITQDIELCWRIILFDVLVMNGDRHPWNLAHDVTTGSIQVFDHSHAFGGPGGDLAPTLQARRQTIAIGGHCLASEIASTQGFVAACDMTQALPDYYLRGTVAEACSAGLPASQEALCLDVLKQRRDGLAALVRSNRSCFPKLPAGAAL